MSPLILFLVLSQTGLFFFWFLQEDRRFSALAHVNSFMTLLELEMLVLLQ